MLVNPSNPRALRSRLALLDAAYELIEARALSEISITDVASRSGVTRPTFYQYFRDIRHLAQTATMERIQHYLPEDPATLVERLNQMSLVERRLHVTVQAEPVLRHLQAHRRFYLTVFNEAGDLGFFSDLAGFVSKRIFDLSLDQQTLDPGTLEVQDRLHCLAHGVLWTVIHWLNSDFTGDDEVASMSKRLAAVVVVV